MSDLTRLLRTAIGGISHMIAPRVCRICGQTLLADEKIMCLGCNLQLPRTGVHHEDFNEIHRRLGHHYRVERAAGWFYYKKQSPYAQMVVDAKYGDLPRLDYELAKQCAHELQGDHFFDGIDLLVPMPVYWLKRLRRGYNQAMEICRGISEVTGIPIAEAVRATKSHGVQSRHKKAQRYTCIANTMGLVNPDAVRGKNVLLVDDIITTGASCTEALRALSQGAPASLNVLALCLTLHY